MDGKDYCGLSIYWNYLKRFVDISMPGFTGKTHERLQHKSPSKPQHAPHKWNKLAYGQKTQLVPIDTSPQKISKNVLVSSTMHEQLTRASCQQSTKSVGNKQNP